MTDLVFLGTGTMGLPMARNLLEAGFNVHAYNRTPDRARPLQDDGAQLYADAAAAADGCPLMVTMLSDGDSVLEVATAALAASTPPDVWIQMSTIGVQDTERCAELADDREVTLVDAPVLGTRDPAQEGKLVILASGPESARPAVDPVFEAVGARTEWLGEAGAATAAKVVINGWVVGVVGVLAEVITLAEGLGVDPQVFFDAVRGGPLDLPYAQLKGGAMIKHAFDDVSFRLALARKDTELLLTAAGQAGLELPIMEGALTRLRAAQDAGHGDEDMAATYWASAPDGAG
ncbi:MAG: NAD(P)-dependent oxidoreductase [Solirubrobacterales bacterium]|nr:NAD(P)-dependent oxidoreductase [Solirubrobacterales bacterium]